MWPKTRSNRYYSGPKSDHFDGKEFFNPVDPGIERLPEQIKRMFSRNNKAWARDLIDGDLRPDLEERVEGHRLVVTMIGHATLLIQTEGLNILTDPIWSDRASPSQWFGPKRWVEPAIPLDELPAIDAVLITHNHYDHMDAWTIRQLVAKDDPLFISSLGNDTILKSIAPDIRVEVGDWGDRIEGPNGLPIRIVRCHHWSARGILDKRHALWSAFVIESEHGPILHIGDTAFSEGQDYRDIGEKYGTLRHANLPIGAYMPRWYNKMQHQSPDEAAEGFLLCRANHAIGHHWATFRLTEEARSDPEEDLNKALGERTIEQEKFRALRPGESVEVPELTASADTDKTAGTGDQKEIETVDDPPRTDERARRLARG